MPKKNKINPMGQKSLANAINRHLPTDILNPDKPALWCGLMGDTELIVECDQRAADVLIDIEPEFVVVSHGVFAGIDDRRTYNRRIWTVDAIARDIAHIAQADRYTLVRRAEVKRSMAKAVRSGKAPRNRA